MTNFNTEEAYERFSNKLRRMGIDEELEKILQKYPLEEGYDITVVPIDATREKIIIKKVQKEEKASLTK